MTPPSTPARPESPIFEWPHSNAALRQPLPMRKPLIERVRDALEKCGIVNEHAVQAVLEVIESNN